MFFVPANRSWPYATAYSLSIKTTLKPSNAQGMMTTLPSLISQ